MEAIYSSVDLRDHLREVKDAAMEDLVRITENGRGAFVFCSEEVYERNIHNAVEMALYEERLRIAVERGMADIEAGRVFHGTEELMAEVERRRAERGWD